MEIENNPSVYVQRRSALIRKYGDLPDYFRRNQTRTSVNIVIRLGDIISLDSDIMIMRIITDTHQHAYVLKLGEIDVPAGLKDALKLANYMQDEYAAREFQFWRTGIEIVEASDLIPRDSQIISSRLGFHPPPRFIRQYSENRLMFSPGLLYVVS